jgi:GMP synthase (glutamine-hydrolysing)
MRPVLLVRNEHEDDFGLAREAIQDEGLKCDTVDAWDPTVAWPSLEELSAVVVFGGAMNCDQVDRYPHLARVRSLMADAVREELPVLGVCLGAQILVRAFGCPVFPAARRELGFPEIRIEPEGRADPVLGALPARVRLFQWHEDAFDAPPGATLLARDANGGTQAFRHGRALAVQFHPEVTAPELDRWFAETSATLQPVWGRVESELRREVAERIREANAHGRELFHRFARYVKGSDPV